MQFLNNPVGRLHFLLKLASQETANQTMKVVWSKIFEIEPTSIGPFLRMYSQLLELVYSARRNIEALPPETAKLYLEQFAKIEKGFMLTNFDVAFSSFRINVDDTCIFSLAACAHTIMTSSSENIIEKEKLMDLLAEVRTLYDEIDRSDLDLNLRLILLENLDAIIQAIMEYKIRGTHGLRRALEASLGAVGMNQDVIQDHETNPLVSRFRNLLIKINIYAEPVANLLQISGPVTGFVAGYLSGSQPKPTGSS